MRPKEINGLLSQKINEVCQRLLPNGKMVNGNWEVGDLSGQAGQSLKVALSGKHLGGYTDFSTDEKGDIINLWQNIKGLDFYETMKDIKSYLGLKDDFSSDIKKPYNTPKNKPVQSLPKYDLIDQVPSWCKYLDKRKLSAHTAKQYKIGVMNGKLFFPHFFNDKPVMWHTRFYPKDSNGKYILDKDGRPKKEFGTNKAPLYCLWGWDGIKSTDREVVITEGRIDALSYIEQEIPALSVPCGGGKGAKQSWIDFDYHHLIDHFDTVYISMDADSVGHDALSEIVNRLGEHICRIVELPEGIKDGNKAHVKGVDLKKCLHNAKHITPEGLHRGGEFERDIMDYFYPDESIQNAIYLPWKKSEGYVARIGEVTLLAGENGSGKTQAVGNIMLAGFAQDEVFGVASMEMSPKMLLGRLTRQATGMSKPKKEFLNQVSKYFDDNLWLYKKKGIASKDKILSSFLYLNKRYGVRYFVIDSLAKCGFDEDDYRAQKNFIDEIEAFVDDNQCHIFLVHHLRKAEAKYVDKPPSKSDVKGTGAIMDMIDNAILWWRNRPKEDFLNDPEPPITEKKAREKYDAKMQMMKRASDAIMVIAKQRNGDWEGKVPLWFDRDSYQFLDFKGCTPVKFLRLI